MIMKDASTVKQGDEALKLKEKMAQATRIGNRHVKENPRGVASLIVEITMQLPLKRAKNYWMRYIRFLDQINPATIYRATWQLRQNKGPYPETIAWLENNLIDRMRRVGYQIGEAQEGMVFNRRKKIWQRRMEVRLPGAHDVYVQDMVNQGYTPTPGEKVVFLIDPMRSLRLTGTIVAVTFYSATRI